MRPSRVLTLLGIVALAGILFIYRRTQYAVVPLPPQYVTSTLPPSSLSSRLRVIVYATEMNPTSCAMAGFMRQQGDALSVMNYKDVKKFADGTTHEELSTKVNKMWPKVRFMIHELGQPHVFATDPNNKDNFLRDDDIVLFLDAWDTMIQKPLANCVADFKATEQATCNIVGCQPNEDHIFFNGETTCFPFDTWSWGHAREYDFPPPIGKMMGGSPVCDVMEALEKREGWRGDPLYLNSGAYFGRARALRKMFFLAEETLVTQKEELFDQSLVALTMLRHPDAHIHIDTGSRLMLTTTYREPIADVLSRGNDYFKASRPLRNQNDRFPFVNGSVVYMQSGHPLQAGAENDSSPLPPPPTDYFVPCVVHYPGPSRFTQARMVDLPATPAQPSATLLRADSIEGSEGAARAELVRGPGRPKQPTINYEELQIRYINEVKQLVKNMTAAELYFWDVSSQRRVSVRSACGEDWGLP